MLELLSLHKADILRLLRRAADGWSPEDWQIFFDECAAIAEFDGGLPRAQAEARAFACCVAEWINRNPTPSAPGRCLACSGGERPWDPLLPFGTDTIGHAWVHRACCRAWYRAREAEAIAALASVGIRSSERRDERTATPASSVRWTRDRKPAEAISNTVDVKPPTKGRLQMTNIETNQDPPQSTVSMMIPISAATLDGAVHEHCVQSPKRGS